MVRKLGKHGKLGASATVAAVREGFESCSLDTYVTKMAID